MPGHGWPQRVYASQGVPTVQVMDIYLDANATTPPAQRVVDTMLPHLRGRFGNAASSHPRGRAAAAATEDARDKVAALLEVTSQRVVWTSGATEALNAALKGLAEVRESRNRLLVGATEHKAVLDVADWLAERRGVEVAHVPATRAGTIDLDALRELLDEDVFAVAVMAANNETGVINPVVEVAGAVHEVGAAYVCDATQQAGKIPCDLSFVDFAAVSSHKMYGPQGVGALICPARASTRLDALIHGGGHERGLRSGTLNLPGIVGFGAAAELALTWMDADAQHVKGLRDRLEWSLDEQVGRVTVLGGQVDRLPNTSCVWIEGVDADALIVGTPEVAFSSGSACTSSVPSPSHVLTAMGVDERAAEQSVRFSLCRDTSADDIERAVDLIAASCARLRELDGAA